MVFSVIYHFRINFDKIFVHIHAVTQFHKLNVMNNLYIIDKKYTHMCCAKI